MPDLERCAIHTITTKPWDLGTACAKYSAAGVTGVGLWRQWLDGRPLAESRRMLDDHGLRAVSFVRGGFFPAKSEAERLAAIDDNRRCLDEAAALEAPQVVLVCGAIPGMPLEKARQHIADGIAACLDHAAQVGVKLAIEPLHPMYADSRSAVNTLAQANDIIDELGAEWLGIALDVYHVWWDPALRSEIARAGQRIIGFHVCDWLTPTTDLLNDRGLMGEGCIDIAGIRKDVEKAGFIGPIEVEIFSIRHWARNQDEWLAEILQAWTKAS
ncbi:MAG: sugar phosphate isomerase/epimerase family protein [Opitutales bacterium]